MLWVRLAAFFLFILCGSAVTAFSKEPRLPTAAPSKAFLCQCQANRPGFESQDGSQKFCDYDCSCQIFSAAGAEEKNLTLHNLATTAYSFEDWDRGSHICHGQYAWRPTMSSPNWQIQPRFSSFTISNSGTATYPDEGVETSPGVLESIQRSSEAPEVRDAIQSQLK